MHLLVGLDNRIVGLNGLDLVLDIAAKHDVRTSAGHIGGDRDDARAPGLRHDVGFSGVLLGVKHLVRQLGFVQQARNQLRILDRGGAHQNGLTSFMALTDIDNHRFEFLAARLVDEIELVFAHRGPVWRDHHGFKAIDFLELVSLGVSRSGHARQLAVHAEIVLEGDRRKRLVFALDRHAFLGLDRLMQAVRPATPRHQTACEFVDDHDFRTIGAVLHHVVLVTVVEVIGAQRGVYVVHQRDVGRVVEAGTLGQQSCLTEQALGILVTVFGQVDLVCLLIDREIARLDHAFSRARVSLSDLLFQLRHHGVDAHVHLGVVFCLATDDQRRSRLVNQNRINLVNDGIRQAASDAIGNALHHVVAQVIKSEFIVRAVRDVGRVRSLLVFT